jgi:hypothetical protein
MIACPNPNTDEWRREEPWGTSNCPKVDTLDDFWANNAIPINSVGFVEELQMSQTQIRPFNRRSSVDFNFDDIIFPSIDRRGTSSNTSNDSPPPMASGIFLQLELSALLGEMQKYLHTLKTYHVSENRLPEHALNDYPIGEALYLLRRFCELQERIRENASRPSTWAAQSAIEPDMVAALVIVTCYLTMIRILHILFGHLDHYLAQISPPESAAGACQGVAEFGRGLRLGELTPINDVCIRTREAVGALLKALGGMDVAIGNGTTTTADDMDEMSDSITEAVAIEDGLTVHLLKEQSISRKINDGKQGLDSKILEVKRHLYRLLNASTNDSF